MNRSVIKVKVLKVSKKHTYIRCSNCGELEVDHDIEYLEKEM